MDELQQILNWMQTQFPDLQPTFHDGKNELGKQITNPTYGFGAFEQTYANGDKKIHFGNTIKNRFTQLMSRYWQSQSFKLLYQFQKVRRFEFEVVEWCLSVGLGFMIDRSLRI